MTLHSATYVSPGWQVRRSDDGGRTWEPIGPVFEKGREARAFIAAREGQLTPLRSGPDDSPRRVQSGTAEAAPAGQDKTAE